MAGMAKAAKPAPAKASACNAALPRSHALFELIFTIQSLALEVRGDMPRAFIFDA
jgi:hypothetical protein